MKKNAIWLIVFIFIIELIPIFYFKIYQLEELRSLFTIYTSLSSTTIGIAGAFLGYYYYKNKLEHDQNQEKIKKIGNNINSLLNDINSVYDLLIKIFRKDFTSDKELKILRCLINDRFDNITTLLESNDKTLLLDDIEIREITKHYSMIEKSDIIMHSEFDKIIKSDLATLHEHFEYQRREVRRILIKKMQ